MNKITNEVKIWDVYYPVIIICYILTVYTAAVHPGVIASALLILIGGCAAVSCVYTEMKNAPKKGVTDALKTVISGMNICDAFMAAFVLYNILSVVWIIISGMPLSVYTGELATFILPAVMYIVGRCSCEAKGFYKGYFWGLALLCGVGLIFYLAAPQNYLDYLYDWSYISLADVPTMRVRMHSVCGSTILGSFCAAGILTSSYLFVKCRSVGAGQSVGNADVCEQKESSERGTDVCKQKEDSKSEKMCKIMGIAGIIIGFIFAVLSNQRSAMVVAILAVIYLNILAFFTFKMFKKKYFYIEMGAIAAVFILALVVAPDILLKVYYRLASLPSAIGERSEQWVAAVNMMFSSWIGNGLGANGHRALGIEGVKVVADGGLVKMFCENGVIGFSLFVYLLILVFKRGIKVFSECYAEIGIVSIILLQSIGSNTLSFQLITPLFWYAIGRIVFLSGSVVNNR